MRNRHLPLLVFAGVVVVLIGAARPTPLQRVSAPTMQARADTDSVVRGRAERIVILPMPIPDSIRPLEMIACFDVDTVGTGKLLRFSTTRDSSYNRALLRTLQGYRFRPSTFKGVAVRDTICVRAVGP